MDWRRCQKRRKSSSARSCGMCEGLSITNCYNRDMEHPSAGLPETIGSLKKTRFSLRTVKDELRENLICKLKKKEPLFPGIVGYEETVVPQVINAVLSKHNFILLGLRGQAKTKLIRMLVTLLDEHTPYIRGCEIRDN